MVSFSAAQRLSTTSTSRPTLYAVAVCVRLASSLCRTQTAAAYSAAEVGVQAVEKLKEVLRYVNTFKFLMNIFKASHSRGHFLGVVGTSFKCC